MNQPNPCYRPWKAHQVIFSKPMLNPEMKLRTYSTRCPKKPMNRTPGWWRSVALLWPSFMPAAGSANHSVILDDGVNRKKISKTCVNSSVNTLYQSLFFPKPIASPLPNGALRDQRGTVWLSAAAYEKTAFAGMCSRALQRQVGRRRRRLSKVGLGFLDFLWFFLVFSLQTKNGGRKKVHRRTMNGF